MLLFYLGLIVAGVLLFVIVITGVIVFFKGNDAATKQNKDLRTLLQTGQMPQDREGFIEEVKAQTGVATTKLSKDERVAAKLFQAGYYTPEDKARFFRLQTIMPVPAGFLLLVLGYVFLKDAFTAILLGALGAFAGFAYPLSGLDRKIRKRDEEILYYLPLVIEQLSIGVSSGLDIGPCIAFITQTASERRSHNPVTEMLVHVERLIQAGMNLEDALMEIGLASGHKELKHAFMFLSQCAKHGGEVTRQLQDLADAVATERIIKVEARIVALPVKATGPLALVFAGFLIDLVAAIFLTVLKAISV